MSGLERARSLVQAAVTESALAAMALLLAAAVLDALVKLGALPRSSSATGIGFLYGPATLLAAAALYAAFARRLLGPVSSGPVRSVGATAAWVVPFAAWALVGSEALAAAQSLLGIEVVEQDQVLAIVERGFGPRAEVVMLCVAALVLAPVGEEWFFRGLLFRRLAEHHRGLAFVLSSLGFAAIHQNPSGLLVYAWLGCAFAWALLHTGRIAAAIAVHALNNAAALVLLFVAPPETPVPTPSAAACPALASRGTSC